MEDKTKVLKELQTLIKKLDKFSDKPYIPDIPESKENNKTNFKVTDNDKDLIIEFLITEIDKNKFIERKIKEKDIKAYLLYIDSAYNLDLFEIKDFKIRYRRNIKQEYNFLDRAIFNHNGKPVFFIFMDSLISVDKVKMENEKFVTIFSPESWYNIEENVVTAKLTAGEEGMGNLISKYWKYAIVIIIVIIGILVQQGLIKVH